MKVPVCGIHLSDSTGEFWKPEICLELLTLKPLEEFSAEVIHSLSFMQIKLMLHVLYRHVLEGQVAFPLPFPVPAEHLEADQVMRMDDVNRR